MYIYRKKEWTSLRISTLSFWITYKTARACMRPITDGICPESWLPCKDLGDKNLGWSN